MSDSFEMASNAVSTYAQVVNLQKFLLESLPNDVMMPCTKGCKIPLSHHKNGAWQWDHFFNFSRDTKFLSKYDVGITLHDMCVVDVDDRGTADQMERRFPELNAAPCELTRKGKHYFFRRSDLANQHGYFDGHSQVTRGVDFKTVSKTGTGGFIVVAPSTYKSWVRPPWEVGVPTISDELLQNVAVPKCRKVDVRIRLGHEEYVWKEDDVLSQCSTVRSVLEEFPDEAVYIGAPHTIRGLEDLLFCCRYGVTRSAPTRENVAELIDLANYLGVPSSKMTAFRIGGYVHRMLDVASVWPQMADLMHADSLFRAGAADPEKLVHVSDVVASFFDAPPPSVFSENWLFAYAGKGPLLEREVDFCLDGSSIPRFVRDVLLDHAGKTVLAGGGALSAIIPAFGKPGDYDIFIVGAEEDESTLIVKSICSHPDARLVFQTPNAKTLCIKSDLDGRRVSVQVILRRYKSTADLLASFDISPCKCAVAAVPGSRRLEAVAHPSWSLSVRSMCFVVALDMWGTASFSRVMKYAAKGFRVYVPCTRRDCFKTDDIMVVRGGVSELFAFESNRQYFRNTVVSRKIMWHMSPRDLAVRLPPPPPAASSSSSAASTATSGRTGLKRAQRAFPTMPEINAVIRATRHHTRSDYSTFKKMTGSAKYWMKWMWRRPVAYEEVSDIPLVSGRGCNFAPRPPLLAQMYEHAAWRTSFEELVFHDTRVDIDNDLVDYVRRL